MPTCNRRKSGRLQVRVRNAIKHRRNSSLQFRNPLKVLGRLAVSRGSREIVGLRSTISGFGGACGGDSEVKVRSANLCLRVWRPRPEVQLWVDVGAAAANLRPHLGRQDGGQYHVANNGALHSTRERARRTDKGVHTRPRHAFIKGSVFNHPWVTI